MATENKVHVMCDLETTGTRPGCCVLSLAVVPFATVIPVEPFYEKISWRSSLDAGFNNDEDTLLWWNRQKQAVQDEAFSGTRSVESVLESLSHYMAQLGEPKDIILWGNGADFDNAILSHCYKHLGLKQPWDFRNNRCYRTLKNMYPHVEYVKPDVSHNALSDAVAQSNQAEMIFNLAKKGVPACL